MKLKGMNLDLFEMSLYDARKNPDGSVVVCLTSNANVGFALIVVLSPSEYSRNTERVRVVEENSRYGDIHDIDVFIRYTFPTVNNGMKYVTDSNGIDRVERSYNPARRPEDNYYPITKFVRVEDDTLSAMVLVNRASGVGNVPL